MPMLLRSPTKARTPMSVTRRPPLDPQPRTLAAVELLIAEHARSGLSWLDEGLLPLLTRPGKRLRPRLVLEVAGAGPEPDPSAASEYATAVELMHLSSLIHDDLMDRASTRGGRPTLHTSAGVSAAVMGGDWLVSAAGVLAARH